MKTALPIFALLALVLPTHADSAGSASSRSPHDLVFSAGADGRTVDVSTHGVTQVPLHLKNLSAAPITVVYVALNSPAFLLPVTGFTIAPGELKDFTIEVDGRRLHLPSSNQVIFQLADGAPQNLRAFRITFTSKEVFTVAPEVLLWRADEPAAAKVVKITNVPQGAKVLDVRSSSDSFTAKLIGDSVEVTPASTQNAGSAQIALVTEPPMQTAIQAIVVGTPQVPSSDNPAPPAAALSKMQIAFPNGPTIATPHE